MPTASASASAGTSTSSLPMPPQPTWQQALSTATSWEDYSFRYCGKDGEGAETDIEDVD